MASRDPKRPNVLFILSDDQGQWAAGCYGNREIETPAIDSIAEAGVRFDNFYCTSPVCSPARASLLTGRIPSQHGIHDWIREGNFGADAADYLFGIPAYTELLSAAGYRCGLSGKWHLGDSLRPQKGFSHWYVHQSGGGPYYGAPMIRDGEAYEEPLYVTDAITQDAAAFLSTAAADSRPFYLGVHYTAPHSPWLDNHPKELLSLYADCSFESCPDVPFHPWCESSIRWGLDEQTEREGWEKTRHSNLAGYFAAVTGMDRGIASLLRTLHENDLERSTLVVFTSDNGMNMGHHGVWGKGNGTFPQNMYDSSIKVPMVASLPGRIGSGRVVEELVGGYDFMPTLLDFLSIANPESERLPGRSFAPLLESGISSSRERDEVVVFDEYGPVRMIRTREWKYVHRYFYGPDELYDLANDPGETVNLVDDPQRRGVVLELRRRLEIWFERWADGDRDGSRLPVSGMGQTAPLGVGGYDGSAALPFEPFRRPGEQ